MFLPRFPTVNWKTYDAFLQSRDFVLTHLLLDNESQSTLLRLESVYVSLDISDISHALFLSCWNTARFFNLQRSFPSSFPPPLRNAYFDNSDPWPLESFCATSGLCLNLLHRLFVDSVGSYPWWNVSYLIGVLSCLYSSQVLSIQKIGSIWNPTSLLVTARMVSIRKDVCHVKLYGESSCALSGGWATSWSSHLRSCQLKSVNLIRLVQA